MGWPDKTRNLHSGFTIVEVVTVIAVIGVLVTLTAFYVSTWRTDTATNVVKHDLLQVRSAMDNARNFSTGYPAAIPTTFTASEGVTVTLVSSSATQYCARAVNEGVTYHISNSGEPTPGNCP